MRLARFRDGHGTWVGRVDGEVVVPLAPGDGHAGQEALLRFAVAHNSGAGEPRAVASPTPVAEVQLLAPVAEPPSIRDFYAFEAHVATARSTRGLEMEPDWYELPVFYFSNPGAVLGPDEPVHGPVGSAELDYELEVAAVIGFAVRDVDADEALAAIAGYTVMNDWSARDLQRREMRLGLGPAKGKDFGTSLGPVLVTPDELADAASGRPRATMTARVNGEEWSRGELADLHFTWGQLIAHAARDAWLRPGDVIGSGTVGTGCILELAAVHGGEKYPWLQPGDRVELDVAGIGVLRTDVAIPPL